jgi:hypothetical protein
VFRWFSFELNQELIRVASESQAYTMALCCLYACTPHHCRLPAPSCSFSHSLLSDPFAFLSLTAAASFADGRPFRVRSSHSGSDLADRRRGAAPVPVSAALRLGPIRLASAAGPSLITETASNKHLNVNIMPNVSFFSNESSNSKQCWTLTAC